MKSLVTLSTAPSALIVMVGALGVVAVVEWSDAQRDPPARRLSHVAMAVEHSAAEPATTQTPAKLSYLAGSGGVSAKAVVGPAAAAAIRDIGAAAEGERHAAIAPSVAPAPPLRSSGVRFAIGDRVEIKVFESLASATTGARSFVERGDLSGEMQVEAGGVAYAPFLGAIELYGRSPEELTEEISTRTHELMGFEPRVNVKLVSRQPVFVSGAGAAARSLDFQPGMLLVQALSNAGAGADGQDPLWQRIDLAREEERLHMAERTLARSQALKAALEAEAAGEALETEKLGVGLNAAARTELETVIRLRALENAEREQKRKALTGELLLVEHQIAEFHERIKESQIALRDAMERADHSRQLSARGTTNSQTLTLFEGHLREESMRNHELRSALMRLDTRSLEIRNALSAQKIEIEAERQRALDEAKKNVREAEASIAAIGHWIQQAAARRLSPPTASVAAQFKICRSKPSGVSCTETGDLYVALEPGDIVEAAR